MAKELNKAAALEALQTESTFTAAATKAGISRRTLYGYIYDDKEFAFEWRRQLQLKALARAEQAAEERETALAAIREIMNDAENPAAVRLKAAERLLEHAAAGFSTEFNYSGAAVDVHTGWGFIHGE